MINRYDRKLDRLITHNSVTSSYSNGMHDFIMDEMELGARVALALGEEDQAWWVLIGDDLARESGY